MSFFLEMLVDTGQAYQTFFKGTLMWREVSVQDTPCFGILMETNWLPEKNVKFSKIIQVEI